MTNWKKIPASQAEVSFIRISEKFTFDPPVGLASKESQLRSTGFTGKFPEIDRSVPSKACLRCWLHRRGRRKVHQLWFCEEVCLVHSLHLAICGWNLTRGRPWRRRIKGPRRRAKEQRRGIRETQIAAEFVEFSKRQPGLQRKERSKTQCWGSGKYIDNMNDFVTLIYIYILYIYRSK